MLRSILRNFSSFGAAYILDRVVTFLFLMYAARVLGPEVFGQYLLIGTYVMFFNVTFTAGVMPVALREIVRERDNALPVLEQVLSLRLILGLLAYAVLMLITGLALPASTFLPLAALAGTALVIDAFKDSFAAYHTAFERMAIPSAFQAAGALLTAASGVVLLYLGFGIMALLAASAVVNLLIAATWHVLFVRRHQRYRIRLAFSAWKGMLVKAAPIAPMALVFQFNRLANVMLLSLIGGPIARERAVAYFGTAQQLASIPLGFLFGLRRAMVPPVASKINHGERIDEEFFVALKVSIVFLSFPMLVATSVFPTDILLLAFGPQYLQSALPLQFLGAAAAVSIAASFPETFVISYPETKITRFLPCAAVTLLVNLALCLALIPAHSAAGAAFAFLVARGVHLAFFLHYSRALLPLASLGLVRMAGAITVLCVAYAGCLIVAGAIEQTALRVLAVAAISVVGMIAAGHRELVWLRGMASRRRRHAP